jgi:DNA adenine methylase
MWKPLHQGFIMGIPHPIPYQGSKRNLSSTILTYLPTDTTTLIEPFVGSAAVSLAAAYNHRAQRFIFNDLNSALISLWDLIVNKPDHIAAAYQKLWDAQAGQERAFYDFVRDQFNQTGRPDYFLFLLARCVKAAVRYNADGRFNQSPDNRRKGTQPATMRAQIMGASRLLEGKTTFMVGDFREALPSVSPLDVVYMDPPYQGVSGNRDPRYMNGLSHESFVEAIHDLNKRDVSFIVSYDGRTGSKSFGKPLPAWLDLTHIEIDAGRSSQATLLGRTARTIESLYLSAALVTRLDRSSMQRSQAPYQQGPLFEVST